MMQGEKVEPDRVVKIPPLALVPRLSSMCHATTTLPIARATTFIMSNLHDPGLCVKQVARASKSSPSTFYRSFVPALKMPAARYIEDLRIKEALHLLETTDATATAIAVHCGFSNLLQFRCTLKRRKGMGPAAWREKHGGGKLKIGNCSLKIEKLRVETHPSVPSQGKREGAPRAGEPTSRSEVRLELQPEPLDVKVLRLLAMDTLSKKAFSVRLGHKGASGQLNRVIHKLLTEHAIEWTIPDKPNSSLQQYRLTKKGQLLIQ